MAVLRTGLTDDESDLLSRLNSKMHRASNRDKQLRAYFRGAQRLKHLGLAVPEELRIFELVVNWPRAYINELVRRQKVKSIYRPGSEKADKGLQEAFDANNMASDIPILIRQSRIYGRGFVTIGTNAEDAAHPLIRVESPRQMAGIVDPHTRRLVGALRQFRAHNGERVGTLFLPNKTIQLTARRAGWVVDPVGGNEAGELDIDEHNLGRLPVVMILNRREEGEWDGESEMTDIIEITDACARTLTNMQVGAETHALPPRVALGISKGDFVDKNGSPLPVWQAYFTSLWATAKSPKDVQVSQLPVTDLRNFHDTVRLYGELASSVTGLPMRYFGSNTANPASEGAIRADESRIIGAAEESNTEIGAALSWVLATYERFRTGTWPGASDRIAVEWRNPATPTKAEEADAIQKLNGGTPVLSREGSWDEMGWDEQRKKRERGYFADQQRDPEMDAAAAAILGAPKPADELDDDGAGDTA